MTTTPLRIRKAAVLGAGVMGAQIAAHLTNANVETVLFDLPAKEGPKSGIALKAIANLAKLSPAPLAEKCLAAAIIPANYEDDLGQLADCRPGDRGDRGAHGLEARPLPEDRAAVAATAVLASNTSGLSINAWPKPCPKSCATASPACISSIRRATCTWSS